MSSHLVFLKDRRTGATVEAELIGNITNEHIQAVEKDWMPLIKARVMELIGQNEPRQNWPQSWHWNWRDKMSKVSGLLACETCALVYNGELQGLMQVNTAKARCRITEQVGKHLAYVDYVETAPWNRATMVAQPKFGGVGLNLIRAAIAISQEQGFQGRIGLHSLPQSEAFYANVCGMTDLGVDASTESLKYFEMTPAQAAAFSS